MPPLPLIDFLALAFFLFAWVGYHFYVDRMSPRKRGLNAMMNTYRIAWMEQMSRREVRIVDTAITGSLQNGTAFFASTSLIAIGGAATLLRGTDDVLKVFSDLPFGLATTRWLWEVKVLGLAAIFGYAFFKFAWSYRLYNYAAVLIGATPPATSPRTAGSTCASNHGLRFSHPLLRQEGCGSAKTRGRSPSNSRQRRTISSTPARFGTARPSRAK